MDHPHQSWSNNNDFQTPGDQADQADPDVLASPPEDSMDVSVTPRKSHARKRPKSHIPRPPNAFLLYRSDFFKKGVIPADVESKQYNISRIVGKCWKRLTLEERKTWTDLAKEKEAEHARKYPHYQYKPIKRGVVQRRRKARTSEQEDDHCETLRAKYIPDTTGPVILTAESNPSRKQKRKSRVKARVATQRLSPGVSASPPEPRAPSAAAAIDSPVFMEPLLPPSPRRLPQSLPSQWSEQPSPDTWPSYAFESGFEPPMFLGHPIIPPPANVSQVQQGSTPEQSPSFSSSSEMLARPTMLSAAVYIRESFDNSHRGGFFPTTSTDTLEAQAVFERQPFFTQSHATQQGPSFDLPSPLTPETEAPWAARNDHFNGFIAQQLQYTPSSSWSPSVYVSAIAQESDPTELFPSSTWKSTPQHFPMTLDAPAPPELPCLQPPFLSSHNRARHCLDSLTLPLDELTLEALLGNGRVNDQTGVFGDLGHNSSGSAPDWSWGEVADILQICSK